MNEGFDTSSIQHHRNLCHKWFHDWISPLHVGQNAPGSIPVTKAIPRLFHRFPFRFCCPPFFLLYTLGKLLFGPCLGNLPPKCQFDGEIFVRWLAYLRLHSIYLSGSCSTVALFQEYRDAFSPYHTILKCKGYNLHIIISSIIEVLFGCSDTKRRWQIKL